MLTKMLRRISIPKARRVLSLNSDTMELVQDSELSIAASRNLSTTRRCPTSPSTRTFKTLYSGTRRRFPKLVALQPTLWELIVQKVRLMIFQAAKSLFPMITKTKRRTHRSPLDSMSLVPAFSSV